MRFELLPRSKDEVLDIARLWPSGATGTDGVLVLNGRSATETAVKRAAAGRRVLHLATHAFFLQSGCDARPAHTRAVGALAPLASGTAAFADNPLLLSGLAFAGANQRRDAKPRQDDGILTAEEVAGLNLQGTEWAVLSACDTGIGEIKAGEGVFGLRRAFQIAGARTIIMSRGLVEDVSTRLWMRALYDGRFQQHLSTADAMRAASRRVLQNRRARGKAHIRSTGQPSSPPATGNDSRRHNSKRLSGSFGVIRLLHISLAGISKLTIADSPSRGSSQA